eukprot:UN18344
MFRLGFPKEDSVGRRSLSRKRHENCCNENTKLKDHSLFQRAELNFDKSVYGWILLLPNSRRNSEKQKSLFSVAIQDGLLFGSRLTEVLPKFRPCQ